MRRPLPPTATLACARASPRPLPRCARVERSCSIHRLAEPRATAGRQSSSRLNSEREEIPKSSKHHWPPENICVKSVFPQATTYHPVPGLSRSLLPTACLCCSSLPVCDKAAI
ncbi:uncharacterized protein LOC118144963 isoform X2 [Callithrix jacchus]